MSYFRYSKLLYYVCLLDGVYYALTGIWPLIHIDSFIWVTGPKYDIWLVKTVGILILVIGGIFISAAVNKRITIEIFFLAIGCALGLTIIDVYYASIARIWNVYLLDAVGEVVFIIAWLISWFRAKDID